MEFNLDTRKKDEKDETPLLIEAGLLKQLIRLASSEPEAEFGYIPHGKVIVGILLEQDSNEVKIIVE